MAKKKARLGRGLGALLGDVKHTIASAEAATDALAAGDSSDRLRHIPLEQLQRGQYQPRLQVHPEALEQLAESIRQQGVIQPLLVRAVAGGNFEIIAGERRWRAAQLAGLSSVPALVRELPDQTAMAVALIENIQREDLNAIEQARGFARLLDEFGLTHQEIAEAVGFSRAAVTNFLRLLNLPTNVIHLVEDGSLEMGHARTLLALPKPQQAAAAQQVVRAGLSVRKTEQLVKRLLQQADADPNPPPAATNTDIAHLEEQLSQKIGAKVAIQHGENKGKLIIQYHSLDELDGILQRIN